MHFSPGEFNNPDQAALRARTSLRTTPRKGQRSWKESHDD